MGVSPQYRAGMASKRRPYWRTLGTPTSLVPYRIPDGWRYAVHSTGPAGIADGALEGLRPRPNRTPRRRPWSRRRRNAPTAGSYASHWVTICACSPPGGEVAHHGDDGTAVRHLVSVDVAKQSRTERVSFSTSEVFGVYRQSVPPLLRIVHYSRCTGTCHQRHDTPSNELF